MRWTSLVLIDEPDLGLHPFAITQLASMLQSAATRTQALIGTQSVTLVNQLDPADIIVVDRIDGPSSFRRIEPDEVTKRLVTVFAAYQKTLHGPMAVSAIGIAALRAACPHAGEWIRRMKGL